ncbi:MAG: sulfide/dihydroorotate dehydrogenase-like FAD/NAD-binding protein [Fervidicoccaceae archaeon]
MKTKHEVLRRRALAPGIVDIVVRAPLVARKAEPGQFVMVMADERGERIPLTLVDWSREEGWIEMVFLEVGVSTKKLSALREGQEIYHVAGPLGNPSKIERYGRVAVVGGGVANAALYPIARALRGLGNEVIAVVGARSSSLLVFEEKLSEFCDEVHVATDDGSRGFKGFVSQLLDELMGEGLELDAVWIVGPALMMRACAQVAAKRGVPVAYASLNPIMVCGMGMCGACRVKVGGRVRFTCVEGPEFDAYAVDWEDLIRRLGAFRDQEGLSLRLYSEAKRA